jgi:hypothetical protein
MTARWIVRGFRSLRESQPPFTSAIAVEIIGSTKQGMKKLTSMLLVSVASSGSVVANA